MSVIGHNRNLNWGKHKIDEEGVSLMVEYLSLILLEDHVEMDLIKVAGVHDWLILRSVTEVQSLMGFVNFYWCFIQDSSHVIQALTPTHQEGRDVEMDQG